MRKLALFVLCFIPALAIFSQETYNTLVRSGLDKLEDELKWDEIAGLQQNVELLLIYNEVNHLPCRHPLLCVYVVNDMDKPVKKFRVSILDDEGDYAYLSQHKRESSSFWVDESIDGKVGYDIIIHRGSKITKAEREAAEHIEIDHNQCSFIFKKIVMPSK